jgi:hypothetical protein
LCSLLWVVVSDSQSELYSSDILSSVQSSVRLHLCLDLEFNSISEWLSWVSEANLINVPGLVLSIMAVPEDNVSVVRVASSMNVETFSTKVSNVSD